MAVSVTRSTERLTVTVIDPTSLDWERWFLTMGSKGRTLRWSRGRAHKDRATHRRRHRDHGSLSLMT